MSDTLTEVQCGLQRGFTKNCSPSFAFLLLTEAIAESSNCGRPRFAEFIDASKAIDVVWHDYVGESV